MELSPGAYNNAKDASAAWTLRLVADTAECAFVSTKCKSVTGYQTTVELELFAFDLPLFIPPSDSLHLCPIKTDCVCVIADIQITFIDIDTINCFNGFCFILRLTHFLENNTRICAIS